MNVIKSAVSTAVTLGDSFDNTCSEIYGYEGNCGSPHDIQFVGCCDGWGGVICTNDTFQWYCTPLVIDDDVDYECQEEYTYTMTESCGSVTGMTACCMSEATFICIDGVLEVVCKNPVVSSGSSNDDDTSQWDINSLGIVLIVVLGVPLVLLAAGIVYGVIRSKKDKLMQSTYSDSKI